MADPHTAKCGWCLTGRCAQCFPGGDDWECTCKHPNIRYQPRLIEGGLLREIKLPDNIK
jgi:hypothetical protein